MERIVVTALIVVAVAAVAAVVRRRRTADAPTQRRYTVPEQLDRSDFVRPDAPWLVAVFTSASCDLCRSVIDRARVLDSSQVAVTEIEFTADRALHSKYGIDAVPTLVVCDAAGVTRANFVGPVNATDLWAAVAEAREPGSTPGAAEHRHPPPT